ncbi:MAG: hypothetical protein K0Q73_6957, partial [Paenibacillus sp.]|nr:hypothetical protein [Paenibacillus sp.]
MVVEESIRMRRIILIMMTKKKIVLIISVFLLIITSIRMVWMLPTYKEQYPHAVNGVLDLRGIDLSPKKTVPLDGEWEFYPKMLMNDSLPPQSADRNLINLPESWNLYAASDNQTPSEYGSYRLRVLLDEEDKQIYGIRIADIQTSSALFVNGELLGQSGQPAQSYAEYSARNIPYNVSFTADRGQLDIVIHAANFLGTGAVSIMKSITFGNATAVEHEKWLLIIIQLIVCVVLSFHALFACILYLIGTRQKAVIVFALLVMSTILLTLIDDEKLLLIWLPISFEWSVRILLLCFVGVCALLLEFTKHLFPEYSTIRAFRWSYVLFGL